MSDHVIRPPGPEPEEIDETVSLQLRDLSSRAHLRLVRRSVTASLRIPTHPEGPS